MLTAGEARADEAVARLRRIVRQLEHGADLDGPERMFLLSGLRTYLETAPRRSLDAALQLAPARGEKGWWTRQGQAERDRLIAAIDRELFGTLPVPTAAQALEDMARSFFRAGRAAETEALRMLEAIPRTGRPLPGNKRLQTIIARARKSYAPIKFGA